MGRVIDISGQRFGRLVAVREVPNTDGYARWLCQCDCGNSKVARGHTLRDGRTQSCGCLARETASRRSTRHGATVGGKWTPEYRSYQKMRERCLNPNHMHYSNYGGRGIRICERWISSFENFLADMGQRQPGTSLDRIDGNRGYEPGNCRWETRVKQSRNARHVRPIRRNDGRLYQCAAEAADDVGGCSNSIRNACRTPGKTWRGFTWEYAA